MTCCHAWPYSFPAPVLAGIDAAINTYVPFEVCGKTGTDCSADGKKAAETIVSDYCDQFTTQVGAWLRHGVLPDG